MQEWLKISCLLCVFGFVREIKPSESYHTENLLGEWRNITREQANRDVYPVETYTYLASLIAVFLLTDYLRYKPLIITMGATGFIVWAMLLWTTSLQSLQISEFFYGICSATEVAYYTYIYAKVDKKYYPIVTSHTRAAMFAGKMTGAILSQVLLYSELMNFRQLNYVNLVAQVIATIWAFGLPSVDRSLYFHKNDSTTNDTHIGNQNCVASEVKSTNLQSAQAQNETPIQLLWHHFKNAYSNIAVVKWSIWYSVALCGYMQIYLYNQVLWKDINPDPAMAWNGAVEACLTALAAICSLIAGYLHAGRFSPHTSLLFLATLSMLEGGAILMMCNAINIFVSYAGFVLFGGLYAFTVTVASAEVARNLEEDSFGLVFGINTFLALLMQTALTIIVVSDAGFALNVREQFTTYALYFIIIGIIYFISIVVEYVLTRRNNSNSSSINLTNLP